MDKALLTKQLKEQQTIVGQETVKLHEIEDQLKTFEVAELRQKYLNQYYKYPNNSYSCPTSADDYWDVYYFINDIDENGLLRTIKFEKDSVGEIKIGKEVRFGQHFENRMVKVSKEEFLDAWNSIKADMSKLEEMF